MDGLRISLLGTARITRSQRSLNLQRRKGIALLAYLAVTAQRHSRDSLATMFWPDHDQSSARGNLRRDLSRLKSELGENALRLEQDQVALNQEIDLWLDVAEFQARAEQPRLHGHMLASQAAACPACLEALREAVELYQGDFMAGFSLPDSPSYEEWQFFQAESLRQKLSECLQYLVHGGAQAGEYSQAILYARRWLSIDPLHEPAHRTLMQLYAWDGQYAAALRQYQECARLLKSEFKVAPEAETAALYEDIRLRRTGPAPGGQQLPEPLHGAAPAPAEPAKTQPGAHDTAPDSAAPSEADGTALTQPTRGAQPAPSQQTSPARPRHNLPSPATPFVGREMELAEIRRILFDDPARRMLTLLGPGGSGKTRLALQAGQQAAAQAVQVFPDGVWFVPLAPLSDPASIVSAIARALNRSVFIEQDQPHRRLSDSLRRERLLLILDNFEHLLTPESARQLAEILDTAPHVNFLVTSRTRLNLRGEHTLVLGGLNVPVKAASPDGPPAGEGQASGAVELFVQIARRSQPGFQLDERSYPVVVQICQHVQGMPLAIELAAGWSGMLPVEEILTEVERSLDFLEGEWRDLPDRQRSLRAVFNASWSLLTGAEQQAVKTLSLFRAGFTRDAARVVAGVTPKTLLDLMNKSWLQRQESDRYSIHELLRQYTYLTLSASEDELRQALERYCRYYAKYAEGLFGALQGPQQEQAQAAIGAEFDNITEAWSWLVRTGQTVQAVGALLPALFLYAEANSKSLELLQMASAGLHSLGESQMDPGSRMARGVLSTVQAAFCKNGVPVRGTLWWESLPADEEAIRRAWELCAPQGPDPAGGPSGPDSFWSLIATFLYGRVIDTQAAVDRFNQLLPHLRREGQLWEWAFGLLHRERLVLLDKQSAADHDRVDGNLSQAWQVFQSLGDRIHSGHTLRQRGNLRSLQGSYLEAVHFWELAKAQLQVGGEQATVIDISWQIGDTHLELGEFEKAFRTYDQIFKAYLEMGNLRMAASVKSKESFEALRYDEIEHAMHAREESLALARELEDEFQEAWGVWEMGEIWRVAGDAAEARRWFEKALGLFEKLDMADALSFYHRGLGDMALGAASYAEASSHFTRSIEAARATRHEWALAYALSGLGKAKASLGEYDQAAARFGEALALVKKWGDHGIATVVLAGLARFYAAAGHTDQAVRLAARIASHYASWREIRAESSQLLAALQAAVPAGKYAALQAEGEALDLWQAVDQALDGLG